MQASHKQIRNGLLARYKFDAVNIAASGNVSGVRITPSFDLKCSRGVVEDYFIEEQGGVKVLKYLGYIVHKFDKGETT